MIYIVHDGGVEYSEVNININADELYNLISEIEKADLFKAFGNEYIYHEDQLEEIKHLFPNIYREIKKEKEI